MLSKKRLEGRDFIREKIRERDKYICQICGKKWENGQRRFDVHHKDCIKDKSRQYDSYEKEKDNMVTLCHKCHINLPEHKRAIKNGRKNDKRNRLNLNKIIDMYNAGFSQVEIANKIGVTQQAIYYRIKQIKKPGYEVTRRYTTFAP